MVAESKQRTIRAQGRLAVLVYDAAAGKRAMEAFDRMRADNNRRYEAYLSGLTDAERQTIQTFLTQVKQIIADLR